jgi:hypothetical protein
MAKKKEIKRSEQIAIEIQQNEKAYNLFIEEKKRLIEIKEKEYENNVGKLTQSNEKFKSEIVIEAGKILEKTGLVAIQKICGKLKRDLKGYVSNTRVYEVCIQHDSDWLDNKDGRHGKNKGANQYTSQAGQSILSTKTGLTDEPESLTPQEQQFVQAHEQEYLRNQQLTQLVFSWTGKSNADLGRIIHATPKGMHWARKLLEESRDHIITKIKQMTDSDVAKTSEDLSVAKILFDGIADMCYEEHEQRKRKAEMGGV